MATNHYSNSPSFYDDIFRDTDYWDTYQGILQQYSNTPPDTWLGSITGKNSQRLYEHYQNRDAALNALLEQMRADEYNSTSSQVERDRAAGLNPDLLGVNGGAESAPISSAGAPLTPPDSLADVSSAMTAFMGILNGSLGMLRSVREIQGLNLSNIGLEIGNAFADTQLYDQMKNIIKPHITNEYAKAFSTGKELNWNDVKFIAQSTFNGNKHASKMAGRVFDDVLRSTDFTAAQSAYETLDANRLAMKHFTEKMVDFEIKAQKYGLKRKVSEDSYNMDYFDNLDAAENAGAVNDDSQTQRWLKKWRNDYYKQLYDDFQRGSDLAGLMLISSGQPSFSAIFGAGINQTDRGISNSIMELIDKFK